MSTKILQFIVPISMKGIFCWTYQCSFYVIGGVEATCIWKQAGIAMLCNL